MTLTEAEIEKILRLARIEVEKELEPILRFAEFIQFKGYYLVAKKQDK